MTQSAPTVGILAYGSLIDDPGNELASAILRIIYGVTTPFPIEFARMSSSRGNAPTLIPHEDGAPVDAALLVVNASVDQARDMLWRRETRKSDVSLRYPGNRPDRPNAVRVEQIADLMGVDVVLYTSIGSNVTPLTPERLAELAVGSVANAEDGLDGISYLMAAKSNGIGTPLLKEYEAAILRLTATEDLEGALSSLRAPPPGDGTRQQRG